MGAVDFDVNFLGSVDILLSCKFHFLDIWTQNKLYEV